jgi:uncharacterized protein YkwD
MPVRALLSSFLLAVILLTGVSATASAAKAPMAKIALGAKHKAAKKKHKHKHRKHKAKKRKTHKHKAHKHHQRAVTARTTTAPAAPPATPAAPPAPVSCANTGLVPDASNLELVRAAIVCLHNQVRAQNGLGTLVENGALAAAGTGHSQDMVARHYFDHNTPDGGTFVDRIISAGYAGANDAWSLGENLAWGTESLATPAGMMQAWMNSPHHRENLLKPGYRELGIGISLGTPTGAPGGVTVSAEFGVRP